MDQGIDILLTNMSTSIMNNGSNGYNEYLTSSTGPANNYGPEGDDLSPYKNFLTESRFWVQRVLVPIIMVIGVVGNSITIIIMTRRRMRSSTNNYLAALAIFDMLYLIFTFILSLKQYPNIHDEKYYYYWSFCPFAHLITDCCSNSSVWLTVTFTIERFIVVSHPIKGKVICTESRSRKVILCVFTFCFIFVIPVPFEWILVSKTDPVTNMTRISNELSSLGQNELYKTIYYWLTTSLFTFIPLLLLTVFNSFLIRSVHISRKERNQMMSGHGHPVAKSKAKGKTKKDRTKSGNERNQKMIEEKNSSSTAGAKSVGHKSSSSSSTTAVNINNVNSNTDTNANQSNQLAPSLPSATSSSSKQENKITIMLIAVVILFFICQFPTAIMLIIYTMYTPSPNSRNHYIFIGLNNIFNFLMALNSAGNFLLYCLFSQRYRRTFLHLFCRVPCIPNIVTTSNASTYYFHNPNNPCPPPQQQSSHTTPNANRIVSTAGHQPSSSSTQSQREQQQQQLQRSQQSFGGHGKSGGSGTSSRTATISTSTRKGSGLMVNNAPNSRSSSVSPSVSQRSQTFEPCVVSSVPPVVLPQAVAGNKDVMVMEVTAINVPSSLKEPSSTTMSGSNQEEMSTQKESGNNNPIHLVVTCINDDDKDDIVGDDVAGNGNGSGDTDPNLSTIEGTSKKAIR